MKSGIVNLKPLYELVSSESDNNKPWDNRGILWKRYRETYVEICKDIPEKPGFYLWGLYDQKNKYWNNIYLGMAGTKKSASLINRIKKEMTAEQAFIYGQKYSPEKIHNFTKLSYPETFKKYSVHNTRANRKTGTTHIVWCTTDLTDNKEIEDVENDLIEIVNPTANAKRPTPPSQLHKHTIQILQSMREQIHSNRHAAFKLVKGKIANG